jgi:hypothetical protein
LASIVRGSIQLNPRYALSSLIFSFFAFTEEPYSIDWKTLASNWEVCELSYEVVFFPDGTNEVRYCPFYNYHAIRKNGNVYEYTTYPGDSYCSVGQVYQRTPIGLEVFFPEEPTATKVLKGRTIDCSIRKELEAKVVFNFGSFAGYVKPESTHDAAYQTWLGYSKNLEPAAGCFGTGGLVEQKCEGKESCDSMSFGCTPDLGAAYVCGQPLSEDNYGLKKRTFVTRRQDVSGSAFYMDSEKEFTHYFGPVTVECPTQEVSTDTGSLSVTLELLISAALEGATQIVSGNEIFGLWEIDADITEAVQDYCRPGEGITSCTFDIHKTGGYPQWKDKYDVGSTAVWQIDTQCKCPPGFLREPVAGLCVPCDAGSYRTSGASVCLGKFSMHALLEISFYFCSNLKVLSRRMSRRNLQFRGEQHL